MVNISLSRGGEFRRDKKTTNYRRNSRAERDGAGSAETERRVRSVAGGRRGWMFALRGRLLLLLRAKRQHTVSLPVLSRFPPAIDRSLFRSAPSSRLPSGSIRGVPSAVEPLGAEYDSHNQYNFLLQFENEFAYSFKMPTFLIWYLIVSVLFWPDHLYNLNRVSFHHRIIVSLVISVLSSMRTNLIFSQLHLQKIERIYAFTTILLSRGTSPLHPVDVADGPFSGLRPVVGWWGSTATATAFAAKFRSCYRSTGLKERPFAENYHLLKQISVNHVWNIAHRSTSKKGSHGLFLFAPQKKPYPMFIFTSLKAAKQAHFSPCHLHFLPFQIVPNQVQPGTLFTGTGTNPYYGGA